jgi:hypothetical protein
MERPCVVSSLEVTPLAADFPQALSCPQPDVQYHLKNVGVSCTIGNLSSDAPNDRALQLCEPCLKIIHSDNRKHMHDTLDNPSMNPTFPDLVDPLDLTLMVIYGIRYQR